MRGAMAACGRILDAVYDSIKTVVYASRAKLLTLQLSGSGFTGRVGRS